MDGACIKSTLDVYRHISIIGSSIDYGSFLYSNSYKTNLLGLDGVQNQVLQIMRGFARSTPIYVMENELCLPPFSFVGNILQEKLY